MTRRITILLDDNLYIKLRALQAKQIKETNKNVSFSHVMSKELRKGLKKKG